MAEVKWTPERIEILRKYYGTEPVKETVKRLVIFSEKEVTNKACLLHITKPTENPWTDERVEILKQYYPIESIAELLKRLPGLTESKIRNKVHKLQLKKENLHWTEDEINILKQYYPIEGLEVYKRLPGRSKETIAKKAQSLGIKVNDTWPPEYEEIMRQYYPIEGGKVIERLPGQKLANIQSKAKLMGLKYDNPNHWTEDEIEILKEFYPSSTKEELLDLLPKRSYEKIKYMANRLKLHKDVNWGQDEIEILQKFYPTEGPKIVSRLPKRTKACIIVKASNLGIKYKYSHNAWTDEEINILRKYFNKENIVQVAKKIPDRTYNAINRKAHELGLTNNHKGTNNIKEEQKTIEIIENSENTELISSIETVETTDNIIETNDYTIKVDDIVKEEINNVEVVENNDEQVICDDNISKDSIVIVKKKITKNKNNKKNKDNKTTPKKKVIWTLEEDEIVKEYFLIESIEEIMKRLPAHTEKEIIYRAKKLNVIGINSKPDNWKDKDIQMLKEYYPLEGMYVFYRLRRYHYNAIKEAVKQLGLKMNRHTEPWAVEEDYLACKFYLNHIDDWSTKESIEELYNIFVSKGFVNHGRKTIHMKLANCSYIHTGEGLEHASEQNIKVYNKLTGGNLFTRFFRWLRRIFKI